MNYLLDTHTLIWYQTDSIKLPKSLIEIITDPTNIIFVSAISFWEISLKQSIGKLKIDGYTLIDIYEACKKSDFEFLPLLPIVAANFDLLEANYHKDPFDKMLIWQAISNNYTLVTNDQHIKKYHTAGLKSIW